MSAVGKVWKYALKLGPQVIPMPRGAEILSAGAQELGPFHYGLYLWALVDPDSPVEDRALLVVGTGEEVWRHPNFIGTVQIRERVWHVFEETGL